MLAAAAASTALMAGWLLPSQLDGLESVRRWTGQRRAGDQSHRCRPAILSTGPAPTCLVLGGLGSGTPAAAAAAAAASAPEASKLWSAESGREREGSLLSPMIIARAVISSQVGV
jgi:hypothetical protein